MRHMVVLALLVASPLILLGQGTDADVDSQARWQQDIDAFVEGMSAGGTTFDLKLGISSRGQKDFDKLYPAEKFDAEIASLKGSLRTSSDAQIVLQLMRIVAGAHVAHSSVDLPKGMGFEQRIPISFSWLSDGMIVASATQEYKKTVGLRVVGIGSATPEELQHDVEPMVSCENDECFRLHAPGFMTLRAVLAEFHQINADGSVSVTLERSGHEPLVVRLPFLADPRLTVNVYEGLGIPVPMRWTQTDKNYWYRYLEESQTAYIQYSRCENAPKLSFQNFTHTMMTDLGNRAVRRIVIDLRRNGGGDSRVIRPLMRALEAHPQWAGRIYVLIGPRTFSSALLDAIELKSELHATLVGEPTGGKPGSYGEVKLLTLPNSKLVIRYSSKFFPAPKGMEDRTLAPDLLTPQTIGDLLAGHDTALDAAIRTN